MPHKTKRLFNFVFTIAVVVCATTVFFGCSPQGVISQSQIYPIKYSASFNENKPIYVIGHKNPDSDTICSSIAYANFLHQMGYEAYPIATGKLNAETSYALNRFGIQEPETRTEAKELQYVVVDHSIYSQSIDGMDKANILGIIDHHGIGDMTTAAPAMYLAFPIGSTCTIVYREYKLYGIEISKQMAGVMLTGILSDTIGLKSAITTKFDEEAVVELSKLAEIKDYLEYTKDILDAGNVYDSMTIEEIFNSDIKTYDVGDTHFCIASIQSANEEQLARIETDINEYIKNNFNQLEVKHCYVMLVDILKLETKLLCFGDGTLETAKAAFSIDSDTIILKNTVSRKKQIVPPISKVLSR